MASKKLDDCYFYYYSTCYKGDDCPFRHEELALGCETVCNNWKTGNCQNRNCQFRHMLLKKNRKAIPCFWESQPDGCRKPHCPFLHKKGKPDSNSKDPAKSSGIINQSSSGSMMANNIPVESSSSHIVSDGGLRRPNMSTLENDLNFASPPVDPLVVKFEEEARWRKDEDKCWWSADLVELKEASRVLRRKVQRSRRKGKEGSETPGLLLEYRKARRQLKNRIAERKAVAEKLMDL